MHLLLAVKILCAALLPLETAGGILIPICFGNCGRLADKFLRYSAAAAAGVFLGVGLCHMAADANSVLMACVDAKGFPLSMFLVITGILVMVLLDKACLPHSHVHVPADPNLLPVPISLTESEIFPHFN